MGLPRHLTMECFSLETDTLLSKGLLYIACSQATEEYSIVSMFYQYLLLSGFIGWSQGKCFHFNVVFFTLVKSLFRFFAHFLKIELCVFLLRIESSLYIFLYSIFSCKYILLGYHLPFQFLNRVF